MTEGFMSENLKYVPDNTNHPLLSKLESKLLGPKAERVLQKFFLCSQNPILHL